MYTCERCGYNTNVKCNYIRHINRKTKCEYNVQHDASSIKNNYIKLGKKWKCIQCNKSISTKYKKHHFEKTCRKVRNSLRCENCLIICKDRNSKCRHKKRCVKKDVREVYAQNKTNTTVHNLIINNTTHITTNHFYVSHGQEDVKYLLELINIDERYEKAKKCLSTIMDLIYFNKDHPNNQTVRKRNKKSDLIEFRVNDNGDWSYEESSTAAPKILNNIYKLVDQFFEMNNNTCKNIKDFLYYKTKLGSRPEQQIIAQFNGPMVDRRSQNWCTFVKRLEAETLNYVFRNTFEEHTTLLKNAKDGFLNQAVAFAEEYGIEHFNVHRDGECLYRDLCDKICAHHLK